ncbi:MAG: LD-carboxypeptidase [Bacteroidales bacterium]|nr:LD-carboxypeptidase [Bacteroidales bacterium]
MEQKFLDSGLAGVVPPSLKPGDGVAIVSPASHIDSTLIDSAVAALAAEGYSPVVGAHARGCSGSFSADREGRLQDLRDAILDESVRAIICSRGGYGAVHLLEDLDRIDSQYFSKWLVGFSDITALHALWLRKGYASLHAAMAKYIGRREQFPCFRDEMSMLAWDGDLSRFDRHYGPHRFNCRGECRGRVVGGNLAVLGGIIGTPFDPVRPGDILFIEDIAEPIYKVERILWQLRLRGVFGRLGGLMVGQFTEYRPSADHPDMETMIDRFTAGYDFPRAYGIPSGHIEENAPLLMGAEAHLRVDASGVCLSYV